MTFQIWSVCCGQVLDCPRLISVQVWRCDKLNLPMMILGANRREIEIQGQKSWFHNSSWDNPGNSNPLFQDTPYSNPNFRFSDKDVPTELEATTRVRGKDPQEETQGRSSSKPNVLPRMNGTTTEKLDRTSWFWNWMDST